LGWSGAELTGESLLGFGFVCSSCFGCAFDEDSCPRAGCAIKHSVLPANKNAVFTNVLADNAKLLLFPIQVSRSRVARFQCPNSSSTSFCAPYSFLSASVMAAVCTATARFW